MNHYNLVYVTIPVNYSINYRMFLQLFENFSYNVNENANGTNTIQFNKNDFNIMQEFEEYCALMKYQLVPVLFFTDELNDIKHIHVDSWYNYNLKHISNATITLLKKYNVIPDKIDAYDHTKYENDALFKLEIRKKFLELINIGFHDIYRYFNKNKQEYTFWDYMSGSWQKNHGLRIDHFLASSNMLDKITNVNINKKPRSKLKPSDHTPIEIKIN